ncbi:MAG: ornithine carbamoyltransferase [Deltaproteobacteria bacterium]|nr:ornithine carbamoyltransferase [Deltaproteobacteria bacterium]
MVRHFLSDLDFSTAEHEAVLRLAAKVKHTPQAFAHALVGKTLAMIFQKSSTRTRVSFESGMLQLGGHAIYLSAKDIQLGRGEPITDTGKVLSRYLDIIMIRTFGHDEVEALAGSSRVPVINGLDDLLHPCQALADVLTVVEHKGAARGRQLVFVGDGNNVANSLMFAGARYGMHVRVIAPRGYQPRPEIVQTAQQEAAATGAKIEVTADLAAVEGADAVYTDVWASMGQETEANKRKVAFRGFEVDRALMSRAKKDAIFLHCLPAHRGEEVAAEVIDGPQSAVFDQAENRLHVQKALMLFLLGHRTKAKGSSAPARSSRKPVKGKAKRARRR